MAEQSVVRHKRGDTFAFTAQFGDGEQLLTGIASSLKSQVRNSLDALVAELTIEETSTSGQYTFKAANGTADWPDGMLSCDIQYTDHNNEITSSPTFYIRCQKDVTHA